MNIVIDIGNTFVKAALFENAQIVWQDKFLSDNLIDVLSSVFAKYKNIENLIYSASGIVDPKVVSFFEDNSCTIAFNHNTRLPFYNTYQTPQTLGLDRLALVAAAKHLYPNQNVLVIDAGTCITYDIITTGSYYLGGSISPGIEMRFKALNHFTAGLPKISLEEPETAPIGKNTKDAILNGVIQGVVYEIDQNIERYISDFKDLTIILTGGDQHFLSTKLKNSIFANSNFQLFGLHAILEYLLND
jgi:type III pantothenate kinase